MEDTGTSKDLRAGLGDTYAGAATGRCDFQVGKAAGESFDDRDEDDVLMGAKSWRRRNSGGKSTNGQWRMAA